MPSLLHDELGYHDRHHAIDSVGIEPAKVLNKRLANVPERGVFDFQSVGNAGLEPAISDLDRRLGIKPEGHRTDVGGT